MMPSLFPIFTSGWRCFQRQLDFVQIPLTLLPPKAEIDIRAGGPSATARQTGPVREPMKVQLAQAEWRARRGAAQTLFFTVLAVQIFYPRVDGALMTRGQTLSCCKQHRAAGPIG